MSDKQRNFLMSLLDERDITGLAEDRQRRIARIVAGEVVPTGGRDGEASRLISLLLTLPRKAAPVQAGTVDVPAGRYAVSLGGRNAVEFFIVDRPTEGRWAGYTFVKQQASDDRWPVKGPRKNEVLAAIATDPRAALLRYGTELGHCGNCGRTLTDDISREMGIGPDCASQLGIARPARAAVRPAAPRAADWDAVPPAEPAAKPAAVRLNGSSQLQELPGETWEDIFKSSGETA